MLSLPQDAKIEPVQGHFGEWLQGCLGTGGPVALVTLRCPALTVRAGAQAAPLPGAVIARFFDALQAAPPRTGLTCDMPPGGGAGASTASLLALARLAGATQDPGSLARACLTAEGASDPLMLPYPDRALWLSREARVLRPLPPPPRAAIVGGFFGPAERTRADDTAFPDISDLARDWEAAAQARDLPRCAAIAATSARRCTDLRGGADPMPELAAKLGALGHLRAHTGSARGLIFAPGRVPEQAKDLLRSAGGKAVLQFETGGT